ncbi:MAG: hypothetical protein ACRDHZ_01280 [Ktedonobacteraceae bacterium]
MKDKHTSPFLQEAKCRASISRAYYAVFGQARDQLRQREKHREPKPLLDARGLPTGVHQYVRDMYQQSSEPTRQAIGANLDRLRQYRNIVDYELNNALLHNLPSTTQAVLSIAKKTLALLHNL